MTAEQGRAVDPPAPAQLARLLAALESRTVAELVPPAVARLWLEQDLDPERMAHRRRSYDRLWTETERALRSERRSARALLGHEACAELLAHVDRLEPSEHAVRALFEQPAIGELLGNVIYEGVLELGRRADLLGPVIDRLPLLGGLRRRILGGLREEFERRLESTVRAALSDLARVGVEQAIGFVLSPTGRARFRALRRALVQRLLAQPVCDLLPPPATTRQLREAVWSALTHQAGQSERWFAWLEAGYARFGERRLAALRGEPDYETARERLLWILERATGAGPESDEEASREP